MDEEAQELYKVQKKGEALRELQNHQGWKELVSILMESYKNNIRDLIITDDIETRANIKAIENLADTINIKIEFGKDAAETLKTERFKTLQGTP